MGRNRQLTALYQEPVMTEAIDGLKPELLWRYFAEIARIPRPSKHEERIAGYVLATAERLGLRATQDGKGVEVDPTSKLTDTHSGFLNSRACKPLKMNTTI